MTKFQISKKIYPGAMLNKDAIHRGVQISLHNFIDFVFYFMQLNKCLNFYCSIS